MSDLINNVGMHNFCHETVKKPGAFVWRFLFDHFNPDSSWALNPLLPFKVIFGRKTQNKFNHF
jgi:hypothetical protein